MRENSHTVWLSRLDTRVLYFSSRNKRKKERKKGEKRGGKDSRWSREKERPRAQSEEPGEGVTTAALSITIFTARKHLKRHLNILRAQPGLAQHLHNHRAYWYNV